MEGVSILTTQNVTIEYTPASVGERILSYLIDIVILFAWFIVIIFVMGAVRPNSSGTDLFFWVFMSVAMLPVMFYDLVSELFLNGQSIGKRAIGIKVVMLDGSQPTLGAYLMRWLFRLIDITLFSGVVAFITVIVNNKGQRLGDIAAGTTVVKIKPPLNLNQLVATTVPTNYKATFNNALELSDTDVGIIRKVIQKNEPELIDQAAERVRQLLRAESDMPNRLFLETVLKDYQYFANLEK